MSVSPETSQQITVKVILLGESSVGKTSLARRYTDHSFDPKDNLLTIGVDVKRIQKPLMGRLVRLERTPTLTQSGTPPARKSTVLSPPSTFGASRAPSSSTTFLVASPF